MGHRASRGLWFAGLAALLAQPFPGTEEVLGQAPEVLDEIVARVNHEIITLSDIEGELEYVKRGLQDSLGNSEEVGRAFEQQKKGVLRYMIEEKLMVQTAEDFGMDANIDVEVAALLEQFRKEAGIPNMEVFEQLLRQKGSSLTQFRAKQRRALIVRALVGQMVHSKVTLLTTEIEAYYKENLERFTELAAVELAEILFLTEGKIKSQVRQRAEQILAKVKAGAPFEELAKEYSDGPTASKGGLIGSFKKGSITPALEQIVFDLSRGQSSGIVEADYGLQIVKIINKKEPRHRSLEEVRNQIEEELYQQKLQPEVEKFREELRANAYIFISPKYKDVYEGWWN